MAKARLIDGVRPVRGPGRLHPRPAAAPPHQVLAHRARDRARRAAAPDRGARGDPRRREAAAPHRVDRARRRRQGARHPAPHRAARVGRHAGLGRDARSRSPTTRAGCCSRRPACSPAPPTADPVPSEGGAGQARRRRRGGAHHRPRASSRWSPRAGRMVRMSALELPTLPPLGGSPSLSGGAPLAVYVDLPAGEEPLTIVPLDADGPGHRARHRSAASSSGSPPTTPAAPTGRSSRCATATRVVGAAALHDGAEDLVFVTSDAQLLRFPASAVRPQGRSAGGMAGIRLSPGRVGDLLRGASTRRADNVVVTSAGSSDALPGTQPGALKVTPYAEYPAKGRGTGGVRAPPVPARRGRPGARLGRRAAGPRVRPERRRRSSCPRPPASATARAPPTRRSSPGSGAPVR